MKCDSSCARGLQLAVVSVGALLATAVSAGSYSIAPIGFINPAMPTMTVTGISADGSTVVGWGTFDADEKRAFAWTRVGGVRNLGPGVSQSPAIGMYAYGANADGSVIVGFRENNGVRAGRWNGASAFVTISSAPFPDSGAVASATNADASAIVGRANFSLGPSHAVKWSGGTMQDLGVLAGFTNSSAVALNDDASIVVGQSFNYQNGSIPASNGAFRWTSATGMVSLNATGVGNSSASAISEQGSVIVGSCTIAGATAGFRWMQSGGMQSLGVVAPATSTGAADIAADGHLTVGGTYNANEPIIGNRNRAAIWTARTGFVDLANHLQAKGVALGNWKLSYVVGVSADGRTLVGNGNRGGFQEGWVVTIAAQCPADLNNDGVIDDSDFVLFAVAYDRLVCADPAMTQWCPADMDLNGLVEDADFVRFATGYDEFACPE